MSVKLVLPSIRSEYTNMDKCHAREPCQNPGIYVEFMLLVLNIAGIYDREFVQLERESFDDDELLNSLQMSNSCIHLSSAEWQHEGGYKTTSTFFLPRRGFLVKRIDEADSPVTMQKVFDNASYYATAATVAVIAAYFLLLDHFCCRRITVKSYTLLKVFFTHLWNLSRFLLLQGEELGHDHGSKAATTVSLSWVLSIFFILSIYSAVMQSKISVWCKKGFPFDDCAGALAHIHRGWTFLAVDDEYPLREYCGGGDQIYDTMRPDWIRYVLSLKESSDVIRQSGDAFAMVLVDTEVDAPLVVDDDLLFVPEATYPFACNAFYVSSDFSPQLLERINRAIVNGYNFYARISARVHPPFRVFQPRSFGMTFSLRDYRTVLQLYFLLISVAFLTLALEVIHARIVQGEGWSVAK